MAASKSQKHLSIHMTICFMPYVHDANRDIWTFPPAARADPDAFEFSVSSANGGQKARNVQI
jgi:hypothetical protein